MGTEGTDLPDDGDLDWNELCTLYGPALRRVIGRSAPAADVEDILQNTFVRFVRLLAGGRLDLSKPLLPLLLSLADRARIDHWRTRPRETAVDRLPDNGGASEVPGAEMEAVESIADALASLFPRDKRLLLRCEVNGASRTLVGSEEVLSNDALRQALSRARRRFRSAYLATLVEKGVLGVWGVVIHVRARLQRSAGPGRGVEDLVRLGFGVTAAAAITLAVAVAGPPSARADDPVRIVALGLGEVASPALAGRAGPSQAEQEKPGSTRTRADSTVHSYEPSPPARPVPGTSSVELRRAEGTVVAEPDNPSVGIHLEWSDPAGSGHGSAGVEFKCSGGKVATVACPVLRQLPGTESAPAD